MSLSIKLKPETVFSLALSQERVGTLVLATPRSGMQLNLTPVVIGATGREGPESGAGQSRISADTGNQLTQGTDQKLFVPHAQAVADPLAYYILASN